MKDCRKCKNKYKESYSFCPKCGTPYDANTKRARIPGQIYGDVVSVIKKVWNIILYIFGGLLILAYLFSIASEPLNSIFAILFGLSLFQIFYKIIEDKFNILEEKYMKIARVVIPFVIFYIWISVSPAPTAENLSNESNDNPVVEQKPEEQKPEEQKPEEQKPEEKPKEELQTVSYDLKYKLLGDYGKLVEFEGEKEYFYYFPSGTYEVELTRMTGNVCFLWVDYNKGYKTEFGTAYNNKQKLTYTKKGEKQTLTITDDVHLYNSNDCNYKLTTKVVKPKEEEKQKEEKPTSNNKEISMKDLTNYYYEYGYRQGNSTYFGKKVTTSAAFNSSDSSWPKSVYFNTPEGGHYSAACNSFKGDSFKKMSKKSRGDIIKFTGVVDELISSNNYKSGILTFEDCEIIE